MTRDRTKKELAQVLGVSVRTVERYVSRGCPCVTVRGRLLFSEEEVRRWQEEEAVTGRTGRPSHADALPAPPTPAPAPRPAAPPVEYAPADSGVSKQTLAKAELARKLSIARKTEMELASEKALRDLGLDQKIRQAKGFNELAQINQEVAALLASGLLLPARGQAIQRVMAEARQNMLARQQAEPEQEDGRVFLCTEEGGLVLRLFEGIVSDARREQVLALVREHAEADLAENPNVDMAA